MITNQHTPIMTNEILSYIDGKKNLSVLDCTFGGGGHSKKFLEKGHNVTAIDQDENSCPESIGTRSRCNHFSKKWLKSKVKKILL